jgi:predicted RNA binding protein YcfA (HicA-like mRNA interferase family)
MPKLLVLSGRELCKILAQNGFEKVRQKGSHIIMQKQKGSTTITIPVPDHDELKTGTLLGIIRQSDLPRSLFEAR